MRIAWRPGTINLLKNSVARRVFLLFVLCSLLPLSAMAVYSFSHVRRELNADSAKRRQRASKSAGMTVIGRLSFIDGDIQEMITDLPASEPALPVDVAKRLPVRFRSLAIVAEDMRTLFPLFGSLDVLPVLTNEERAHLREGKGLVTTARGRDGRIRVLAGRQIDSAHPQRGYLFGEPNPEYLWQEDEFELPPAEVMVLDQANRVIFSTMPEGVPPEAAAEASRKNGPTGEFEFSSAGERYVASYWTLFMRPAFLNSWVLVQTERKADVLSPLQGFTLIFTMVVLLTFLVTTYLSLRQIQRTLVPIELLKEATQKIRDRQFSHRVQIKSNDEFAELGASFNEMTESMEHHDRVMHAVNEIGLSLSAEKNDARLLDIVMRGAQTVFNADGAVLFLVSRDDRLELAMVRVDSLGLVADSSAPDVLGDVAQFRGAEAAALWAASEAMKRTLVTPDLHAERDDAFLPQREIDRRVGYLTRSFLSTPLRNHENEVIGILQLINAQSADRQEVVTFSADDQRLAESVASQAAVAITKSRLVSDFKGLFEGMTELISDAIDEKSPYTGGHVRRVVDLVMMIAAAARTSPNEALRAFANSEDALYELRIAALLHDCGKIATPVHIQDKGTKLEAIWDRISLIDTRSEILRRDRRTAFLEEAVRRLAQDSSRDLLADIDRQTAAFDRQLEEDLKLLHQCNRGSDHTPEKLRETVGGIARKYAWTSTEHKSEPLVTADELEHLSIPSGTLTPAERQIIDRHVVSTIRMLNKLPYPKRLRNIPAAAGSHHERMDGTGYPNRLAGQAIPIAGRIIGLADVFEALTAGDRPYKKAKSLAEAMDILRDMARMGHIDPELFDVFESQQIHVWYASTHLRARGRPHAETRKGIDVSVTSRSARAAS